MEVAVRDLKNRLSQYLRRVQEGEEVIVTNRGQPVARLTAIRQQNDEKEALLERLRSLPWVGPGAGGKPKGTANPMQIRKGEKSLSQIVLAQRRWCCTWRHLLW